MDSYGYGNYFGSYYRSKPVRRKRRGLGSFGDYNSDLQRLKNLVNSRSQGQLSTISSLASNLADVTADGRLKDDLHEISMEAADFDNYSHADPWSRWQSYLRDVGTVAESSIVGRPAPTSSAGGAASPSGTSTVPKMLPTEDNTIKIVIGVAALATIAGIAYYYYSTGALG